MTQLLADRSAIELIQPDPADIAGKIARRSFCTLATVSPNSTPHVAGVLYVAIDDQTLYINTLRTSRKARNIVNHPAVAVCIPVRRVPVGPPSTVQFQANAEILSLDHPDVATLVSSGRLKSITSHGELDLPDGCFVRIALPRRMHTYGLGMPLRQLVRDPLHAGGIIDRS